MNLVINGENKQFKPPWPTSISEVLNSLSVSKQGKIVELNGDVIQEKKFHITKIKNGDRIEIIHFMGGGSLIYS